MSGLETTSGVPKPPSDTLVVDGSYHELIVLALASLGLEVQESADDTLQVQIPPEQRAAWEHQSEVRLAFEPADPRSPAAHNSGRLFASLWQRVSEKALALEAAPAGQPTHIHQLTEQLFAPYQVDQGRARLSGCTLEPRPFLRLSHRTAEASWQHVYYDESCTPLDASVRERLGLDHLEPLQPRTASLTRERLANWMDQATAAAHLTETDDAEPMVLATVVWCRYATGKLSFEIGEQWADLSFSGWASDIATGHTAMPKYRCPLSGRESYHLVADDEGRITVAEAIAVCQVSGRRVIETDLEICQQTGQRALKEYLATCEQTHRRVLKSTLQTCDMCRRALASVSLVKGRCEACRHLTPVRKDDPTLARLLHQYARLDNWSGWRIGETARLFIFTAASWTQRILVVVDKETLEVQRIATRNRLGNRWTDAPPKLFEELTS